MVLQPTGALDNGLTEKASHCCGQVTHRWLATREQRSVAGRSDIGQHADPPMTHGLNVSQRDVPWDPEGEEGWSNSDGGRIRQDATVCECEAKCCGGQTRLQEGKPSWASGSYTQLVVEGTTIAPLLCRSRTWVLAFRRKHLELRFVHSTSVQADCEMRAMWQHFQPWRPDTPDQSLDQTTLPRQPSIPTDRQTRLPGL